MHAVQSRASEKRGYQNPAPCERKKKEYESPHHVIDALQKLWRLGEKANVCRRRGDAGGPRPSMSLVDWEWLGDIVLQPLRALARPVRVAV
jgi:hypothetical protein